MKPKLLIPLALILLIVLVIAGSCVQRLLAPVSSDIWTPAPVAGAPVFATPRAGILPTATPRPSTATPTRPAPIPSPTRPAATPQPAPRVTPDPNLVVITEADVIAAVAGGGAAEGGATLEGLTVRFADGLMTLSATSLSYGSINVANLTLSGRLVARDGKLELVAESITPRGLVTALIPVFANQALAQYTAQWYIEEVQTLDGRLELRIR